MATEGEAGVWGGGGRGWVRLMALVLVALGVVRAEDLAPVPTRTQTVALRAGWNAVFLEVEPADPDPVVVFSGLPVDVVAAFLAPATEAQFVSRPDAGILRKTGWSVWYGATRPDAFLSTLHAVHGQQAYLIHATRDHRWEAVGGVMMTEVRWRANAYQLVGFSLSRTSPPTFAQFFSGSAAHRHDRIYRLEGGVWERVTDPTAQAMRSGEAFWIYTDGSSRYQGPLSVEAGTRQGLVLGERAGALVLRNASGNPLRPTVEDVRVGGGTLPLSVVVRAVGDPRAPVRDIAASSTTRGWVQPLPTLEAGGALRVPLRVPLEAMTGYVQATTLRITTDLGTETWVPVVGVRRDLERQ